MGIGKKKQEADGLKLNQRTQGFNFWFESLLH